MKSSARQPLTAQREIVLRDAQGRRLPYLSTPSQIAEALQASTRTILYWERGKKIPAAFRTGRVVRFRPSAVAEALGIPPVELARQTTANAARVLGLADLAGPEDLSTSGT